MVENEIEEDDLPSTSKMFCMMVGALMGMLSVQVVVKVLVAAPLGWITFAVSACVARGVLELA